LFPESNISKHYPARRQYTTPKCLPVKDLLDFPDTPACRPARPRRNSPPSSEASGGLADRSCRLAALVHNHRTTARLQSPLARQWPCRYNPHPIARRRNSFCSWPVGFCSWPAGTQRLGAAVP